MIGSHTRLQDNQLQLFFRFLRRSILAMLAATGAIGAQLEPGTVGYGLTVMKGSHIDTFVVEILGTQRNGSLPGRDRILVRLSGLGLEKTGIIQGMSGSPVYVGERLLGAVAYGWSFANEPVGLVTPIEDMLEVLHRDLSGDEPTMETGAPADPSEWQRLASPLWVAGAGPETLRLLTDLFEPMRLQPIAAASGSGPVGGPISPLQPGSAVGVQLVSGDLNIGGIGTVTHVAGKHLVAFGHEMIGSGAIDVPLTAIHIHGILSNQSSSFKLGSATQVIGAARQDRFSGVAAVTDERAQTLPLGIDVHTGTATRHFSFELARHRLYTTGLAQVSLMGSLESAAKALGDASVRLALDVEFEDGRSLQWKRVYTGLNAPISAALEVGKPLRALLQSGFADIRVASVDAHLQVDETVRVGRIDAAWLPRTTLVAGTTTELVVELVPFRKAPRTVAVPLRIPADASGVVHIRVGSGRVAAEWELERLPRDKPANSGQLLRQLRQPVNDDELVVELISETPGLAIDDREWPAPPPTIHRLLTETHRTGHVQPVPLRVLSRERVALDLVLQGELLLTVNIESKGSR